MPPLFAGSAGVAYHLTFWGTRGSIPTPGPAHEALRRQHRLHQPQRRRRPPGHSRCGQRPPAAGSRADERPERTLTADILLSHTHWDHIQGLPFFKPLSASGNSVLRLRRGAGGRAPRGDPSAPDGPDGLSGAAQALAAELEVHDIVEGEFRSTDFTCRAFRLRHPGTTLGYRLGADRRRPGGRLRDRQRAGTGWHVPGSADWRAAAGAVPGGRRHPDSRRDVLRTSSFRPVPAGGTRPRGRRSISRRRPNARGSSCFITSRSTTTTTMDRLLADARQHARAVAPDAGGRGGGGRRWGSLCERSGHARAELGTVVLAALALAVARCSAQTRRPVDRRAAVREHAAPTGRTRSISTRWSSACPRPGDARWPRIPVLRVVDRARCAQAMDAARARRRRAASTPRPRRRWQSRRRAVRRDRKLRRFLRQVPHQRPGGGRARTARSSRSSPTRTPSCRTAPSSRRIIQLVGERIVQALGLPPYPAEVAARHRAVPTEALTDYSRG